MLYDPAPGNTPLWASLASSIIGSPPATQTQRRLWQACETRGEILLEKFCGSVCLLLFLIRDLAFIKFLKGPTEGSEP